MIFKLHKAKKYGINRSNLQLTISVTYGWNNIMKHDFIKINYDGERKKAYATAEIKNPGAGSIMERVLKTFSDINFTGLPGEKVLPAILTKCQEAFGMTWDPEEIKNLQSPSP